MKQAHIPLRSCVVCREKIPKGELIRIVRIPHGRVEVDDTGKRAGRGAYLCHKAICWRQALKKDRLDYALRGRISLQERERLLTHATLVAGSIQS